MKYLIIAIFIFETAQAQMKGDTAKPISNDSLRILQSRLDALIKRVSNNDPAERFEILMGIVDRLGKRVEALEKRMDSLQKVPRVVERIRH